MLLFYNHKAFVGVGFNADTIKSFQYAGEERWARAPRPGEAARAHFLS